MSSVAEIATLAHDWTMGDVERAARAAVTKHWRSSHLDYGDRHDAAWHAIVDLLYSWPYKDAPEFFDCLCAALRALDIEVDARRHHHGLTAAGEEAARFATYWLPVRLGRTDGFSDRICEHMALGDALAVLTSSEYQAIAALAAFDNAMQDAADHLGITYGTFAQRVSRARAKIKVVWFGDETPPQKKADDGTCRQGHDRAVHGVLDKSSGKWGCKVCRAANKRRRRRQLRELTVPA